MLRVLLVALVLVSSCRPRRDLSQYTQEDPKSALVSHVVVGNPKVAAQLKSGFHHVEEGGWRWAARKFVVELRAPFASQKLGASLTLKGSLPEILFSKTGPVQISAKLNQTELPKQQFTKAGDLLYRVDVPAAALSADEILVEITADKALPPNTFPNDGRELALIVTSISLDTKK
jgi:hypothetical protein